MIVRNITQLCSSLLVWIVKVHYFNQTVEYDHQFQDLNNCRLNLLQLLLKLAQGKTTIIDPLPNRLLRKWLGLNFWQDLPKYW